MALDVVKVTKSLTLTTAFAQIHKVYSSRLLTVSMIHIVNTTGGAVTVQLCFVAPGATPVQGNSVLWDYSIPAHDFIQFGEGFVIDKSFQIMALASAGTSINIVFCGTEE